MPVVEISTTRPHLMAKHALTCTSCKPKLALLVGTTSHLLKLETMAAIEWCTFRRAGRKAHA